MHRKTLVGFVLGAALLGTGGLALAQTSSDGTMPAKITNTDPPRGKDKAYDYMRDTGYWPVVGRDGKPAGYIANAALTDPDRGPATELPVYDKPPEQGGVQIGTMSHDKGLTITGAK